MPYIPHSRRTSIDPLMLGLEHVIETPGDLAYVVFRLMRGFWARKPGFSQWAAMRGAIEDQVDEFRRRVVEEYEHDKRKENGDVF